VCVCVMCLPIAGQRERWSNTVTTVTAARNPSATGVSAVTVPLHPPLPPLPRMAQPAASSAAPSAPLRQPGDSGGEPKVVIPLPHFARQLDGFPPPGTLDRSMADKPFAGEA
jgi:hypothetical protein